MLMISKWNDVIYLIWIDVVVEKCHFSCFSNLDFCSWWGYYKRFYGIVVSWKYVLVNIISYVSFFYVYICIWCDVMVYCLCGNMFVYIYIYVYNEWMEWMFLFTLLYVYRLLSSSSNKMINIYINLNVKSVKREERWNNLTNPVWILSFDYIGCF